MVFLELPKLWNTCVIMKSRHLNRLIVMKNQKQRDECYYNNCAVVLYFCLILSLPCVTPYIFCLFRSCTDVICCVIFVTVILSYVALGVVGEHTQGPTGADA